MHPRARAASARLLFLAVSLALVIAGTSAPADAPGPIVDSRFESAMQAGAQDHEQRARERSTPEAAAERRASRTAHRGLDREGAIALAKDRFGPVMTDPTWRGVTDMKGRIERWLNDYAVAIDSGGDRPDGIVQSLLPLRVERGGEKVPVDYDLVERDGAFAPRAPLTPVRLGRTADAAIDVAGVGIGFEAAGRAGGRAVAGRVFYADAQADTDFFVAPTPLGAQALWQLRSQDSPDRLALRFALPRGARLELVETPSGARGAEVVRGDDVLGRLESPSAMDAGGAPVDVAYEIVGSDRLVVRVDHRGEDLEYPLLVDPNYVYDEYNYGVGEQFEGWNFATNNGTGFFSSEYTDYWFTGMYIGQRGGQTYGAGQFGEWSLWAHGGSTYIYGADMEGLHHKPPPEGSQNYFTGLASSGGWQSLVNETHTFYWGYRGHCQDGRSTASNWPGGPWACSMGGPHNKIAWGTWLNTSGYRSLGEAFARNARIYMSDPDTPSVSGTPTTSAWSRDFTQTSNLTASDGGLGIDHLAVIRADTGQELGGHGTRDVCGNRHFRCASSGTWGVTFSTYGLPEGERTLRAKATDPPDHEGLGNTWLARIDRTAPRTVVTGFNAYRAVRAGLHSIKLDGYDVNPGSANALSGARTTTVTVDGAREATIGTTAGCDRNCETHGTWTLDGDAPHGPTAVDSFTDTSGKPLQTHVPEQGDAWLKQTWLPSDAVITPAGRVRRNGPGAAYVISRAPQEDDYDVAADVHFVSLSKGDRVSLVAKADPLNLSGTFHEVRYEHDAAKGRWCFVTYVNGGETDLDCAAPALSMYNPGETHRVELKVRPGVLSLVVDGQLLHQHLTTAIAARGRGGFRLGATSGMPSSTDTAGIHLDNFRIQAHPPRTRYAEGSHTLTISTNDGAGNATTGGSGPFIVDRTPPLRPTNQGITRPTAAGAGITPVPVRALDAKPAGVNAVSGVATFEVRFGSRITTVTGQRNADGSAIGQFQLDGSLAAYNAGTGFPEGRQTLFVRSIDAAGNRSAEEESFEIIVDRTGPGVTPTGSLYQARDQTISGGDYSLGFTATDGSTSSRAQERSGVKQVDMAVGDEVLKTFTRTCPSGSCGGSDSAIFRRYLHASGQHQARIVARDQVGNETTVTYGFGTVAVDVGRPDIDTSGAIEGVLPAEEELIPIDFVNCEDDPEIQVTCADETQLPVEPGLGQGGSSGGDFTTRAVPPGQWGFSDQKSGVFNDDRWQALGTAQSRLVVSWDVIARGPKDTDPNDGVDPGQQTYTWTYWRDGTQRSVTVPGNRGELESVIVWVRTALERNQRILISFQKTSAENRSAAYDAQDYLPTAAQFQGAVEAFMNYSEPDPNAPDDPSKAIRPFAGIRDFSTWNEPNLPGQPTSMSDSGPEGPRRAARFFRRLRTSCFAIHGGPTDPNPCKIAAGEFIDDERVLRRYTDQNEYVPCLASNPPSDCRSYIRRYIAGLRGANASFWAWHAYNAGTIENRPPGNGAGPGYGSRRLRRYLAEIERRDRDNRFNVWLTEQGGRAHQPTADTNGDGLINRDDTPQGPVAAAFDLDYILKLPGIDSRISRFYLYSWSGGWDAAPNTNPWDSGLTDYTRAQPIANTNGPLRLMYCQYMERSNPGAPCTYDSSTNQNYQLVKEPS